MIGKITKVVLSKQFQKYFISGFTAFTVDAGLLWMQVYLLGWETVWDATVPGTGIVVYISSAHVISGLVGALFSFTLNRVWAFQSTDTPAAKQGLRYALVWCCNYVVINLLYGWLTALFGFWPMIAKVCVEAMRMVWNYFLFKFFVYKQ